jgi:hypothetical protein
MRTAVTRDWIWLRPTGHGGGWLGTARGGRLPCERVVKPGRAPTNGSSSQNYGSGDEEANRGGLDHSGGGAVVACHRDPKTWRRRTTPPSPSSSARRVVPASGSGDGRARTGWGRCCGAAALGASRVALGGLVGLPFEM